MPIIYNGKKIIPAPPISIQKNYNLTDDGTAIGSTFIVTIEGKTFFNKGSPMVYPENISPSIMSSIDDKFWIDTGYPPDETSLTVDNMLTALMRKEEAIRRLFSVHGKLFEVQGYDGMPPIEFNVKTVRSIDFKRGNNASWTNYFDYVIVLETDQLLINGQPNGEDTTFYQYPIERLNETWNIEQTDEFGITFRLVHNINVKGKKKYDETGAITLQSWESAKAVATSLIGLTSLSTQLQTDVRPSTSFVGYNYAKVENVNKKTGEVSLNEQWLLYDRGSLPAAIEDYNIDVRINIDGRLVGASIKGTIRGLELRNTDGTVVSTRYDNAAAYFLAIKSSFYTRCCAFAGVTLNPVTKQQLVNANFYSGVITYSAEYDNRRIPITAGALSEVISFSWENPSQIFAEIPIIGRAAGPIIQNMATITSRKKSLNIEIVMPASTNAYSFLEPNTDALVLAYKPTASALVNRDTISYNFDTGRYSRSVSWTYVI